MGQHGADCITMLSTTSLLWCVNTGRKVGSGNYLMMGFLYRLDKFPVDISTAVLLASSMHLSKDRVDLNVLCIIDHELDIRQIGTFLHTDKLAL